MGRQSLLGTLILKTQTVWIAEMVEATLYDRTFGSGRDNDEFTQW